jgi:hypothetical protein
MPKWLTELATCSKSDISKDIIPALASVVTTSASRLFTTVALSPARLRHSGACKAAAATAELAATPGGQAAPCTSGGTGCICTARTAVPATAAMTAVAMEVCQVTMWMGMCHRQWPPPLYACLQYASIALIIAIQQAQERCHCCADELAGSGASSGSAAASQDLAAPRDAAGGAAEASSGNSSDDSSDPEEASPGGYESEGVPLAARRRHLRLAYAGGSLSEVVSA